MDCDEIIFASPKEYQVFQRISSDEGYVTIKAQIKCNFDSVYIRINNKNGYVLWEGTVPADIRAGNIDIKIPVKPGGWYNFELDICYKGICVTKKTLDHIGVGEMFISAGQSNITNYGEVKQTTVTGMVSSFDGDEWRPANDPQPGTQDDSSNGSIWPVFGDTLYHVYKVPVGVAVVGSGGTSVNQWQPKGVLLDYWPTSKVYVESIGNGVYRTTGQLYDNLIARINQLNLNGFRALLWHQGESDSNQPEPVRQITADEYKSALSNIIHLTQKQADRKFPWFVAQVSYHTPEDTGCEIIRNAQQELWDGETIFKGPDTDTLTGDYRENEGKGVHFSDKGLKAHAKMWAEAVIGYIDNILV
ncbi:MAG: sialate O-acetylesterase [Eubacteriales bacterium]